MDLTTEISQIPIQLEDTPPYMSEIFAFYRDGTTLLTFGAGVYVGRTVELCKLAFPLDDLRTPLFSSTSEAKVNFELNNLIARISKQLERSEYTLLAKRPHRSITYRALPNMFKLAIEYDPLRHEIAKQAGLRYIPYTTWRHWCTS